MIRRFWAKHIKGQLAKLMWFYSLLCLPIAILVPKKIGLAFVFFFLIFIFTPSLNRDLLYLPSWKDLEKKYASAVRISYYMGFLLFIISMITVAFEQGDPEMIDSAYFIVSHNVIKKEISYVEYLILLRAEYLGLEGAMIWMSSVSFANKIIRKEQIQSQEQ